jgi:group I intron endonuclease
MTSGVYGIVCAGTGRWYVGSSKDIDWRWRQHKSLLNKGQHHSYKLQRSWDKRGEAAFTLVILEICGVEALFEREQYHMDRLLAWKRGFNVHPNAAHTGPISAEMKVRIGAGVPSSVRSENAKRQWADPDSSIRKATSSPEAIERRRQGLLTSASRPELREWRRKQMLGNQHAKRPHRPEAKEKKKVTQKRLWEERGEEMREKRSAYWTTERRAVQAERMRKQRRNVVGNTLAKE